MLEYKIHADAFQDNCLINQKVNDYKLFPKSFDYYIKTRLGIMAPAPVVQAQEELEFRYNTVKTFIERFLSDHRAIERLQELNRGTILVELRDGRTLKVFVTNTYYFTDYTLDRVLEVDPAVDAIICSSPAGQYNDSSKQQCIERGIGLFMLAEFMGAIHHRGDQYLNFLLIADKKSRLLGIKQIVQESLPPSGVRVFLFGSFIRRKVYGDIDVLIIHDVPATADRIKQFESKIEEKIRKQFGEPHICFASEREFAALRLEHDNLTQVYP